MATYDELMAALRKADAAGDTEGARRIAQMASQIKAAQPAPSQGASAVPQDAPSPVLPQDPMMPGGFDQQIIGLMQPAGGPQVSAVSAPAPAPRVAPIMAGPIKATMTPRVAMPVEDPLLAALRGEDVQANGAPVTYGASRDANDQRPPSDPFEGEGFKPLAKRRGQQFVRGATEVVASVPESVAITGENLDRSQDKASDKLLPEADALEAEAASLESEIAAIPADVLGPEERAFALEQAKALRDRAAQRRLLAQTPTVTAPTVPAQDRPIFAVGDQIRGAVTDTVGAPDPRDVGFWAQAAEGSGNMAGMIAASAAGGLVGGPAGSFAVGGMTGSTMNQSQVFKEALDAGADQETALQASKWAAVIGAGEIIPINRALKFLPPRLRGELATGFMRKFVDLAQASGEEAAQEYLSQVANNIAAQNLYDPERGWTEGATDAALVGAVLGAGVGGIGLALEGKPAAQNVTAPPRREEPPPAPLDQITAAMQPPAPDQAPKAPAPEQPAPQAAANQTQPQPPQGDASRYEILDEIENGPDGQRVPTGRKVRYDRETGTVEPVSSEQPAEPAAPEPQKPAEPAPEIQTPPTVTPATAAGPAPQADVVQAAGGTVPPAPVPNQPRNFEFIDAAGVAKIGTEPGVMQYKAGGDAEGVTDRLKGVTEWRPERAGMSIIYEYADGRRVIADGHQRLGLAKRLAAEGKAILMPAMILRQVDGVTPEDARVTAALKNIAEGSGTALDAAKVLRGTDKAPDQLGLPPASAIVRDAMGMRNLSDQAFGMVVNGVSSERDGGIVGRAVTDKAAQANILALLARMQKDRPITAFQAESVARQAAADTVVETQDSLFGPEDDTKNLYLERAKILEAASKMKREEQSAFRNVIANADRLAAAGNQLDADGNQTRLDSAAAMRDYLVREANTKGAISEALTAAARALNGGATIAAATRQFLDAVERELGSRGAARPGGDSGGQAAGSNRPEEPGDQGLASVGRDEAADDGDLFAPAQTGKTPDQVRAEAEAAVRAQQSKLRKPGGNSGDAGPLFNPDQDLFDPPKAGAKPEPDFVDRFNAGKEEGGRRDFLKRSADLRASLGAAGPESLPGSKTRDLTEGDLGRELEAQLAAGRNLLANTAIADGFVLEQGKKTGKEHLVVLGKGGELIALMAGTKTGVDFSDRTMAAIEKDMVGHTVHNHPSNRGYSPMDIRAMFMGTYPVAVMGHDGARHVAAKKPQGPKMAPADMAALYHDMERWLSRHWNLEVNSQKSPSQARVDVLNEQFYNVLTLAMARAGLISYEGTAEADLSTNGVDFDGLLPDLFAAMAPRLGRAGYSLPPLGDRGADRGAGADGSKPGTGRGAGADADVSGDRDGAGRVPDRGLIPMAPPPKRATAPEKPAKASTGNAALDGALDDIFGDEADVPSPGQRVERDSGNPDPADGMGGTDVPAAAGRDGRGGAGRTGPGGSPDGEQGAGGGLPGGDAPPVGGGSDPGMDRAERPARKPAAGRKRGAGDGNRAGGLSPDTGRGADPAGDASGAAPGKLTPAQQLAAIRGIFKEDVIDFVMRPGFAEDASGLDPRKAEALESIFISALDGVNVKAASDRDLFRAIILPLRDAGMTREEVAELTPYLESFLADLRAGRVHMDPDPVPTALDRLNAVVPGWTAMNGMLTNPDPERGGIIDQAILGKKWFVVLNGSTRSVDGLDTVDQAVDWFIQNHAAPAKPKPAPRIIPGDRANIDATLPLLLPEQRDDVFKIETRFAKPDGHGMMITNGTGTGKTFSGGGVIKRFVQMGKGDILIVAPSEAVISGWTKALAALDVPVNQLRDTKDAGRAVTITTYANLRDNDALASRSFDLVVTDESQNLMSSKDGAVTGALQNLRAITHRPADLWRKSRMRHAKEWEAYKAMRDGEAKTAVYRRLKSREEAEVARWAQEPRSKVLFLSATPFAYDKAVDYAEGYLFDYPKDGHVGRSRQSGQSLFMVQHFGYRIRYHKLTKPEAAVDSAVFEREFHEKLKRDGVLSGRSLQVDVDYDRKFVLAADGLGTQIDAVLAHVFEGRKNPDKAIADGYQTLEREISQKFNYLKRMQLLEAIKARAAIPDIEKHLALGRKVVVFHDYNVGGGFNPFSNIAPANDANAIAAAADLLAAFPDLNRMKFASYAAPVDALLSALGKRARAFNGTVPQKKRLQNLADFNTDGSGADVLVVQSDAGGAGISMHDLTGTHQRVLINLGMPTKPTTTLQEEGRILRVGTQTNAPFRYYTIGTAWERRAFATRIAERSGTVENLALGNEARDLLNGFIEAYEEAEAIEPGPDDGKGGKERDRTANVTSPFEKAKTHYFGRAKTTGRRDQRDGIDFYPTPEPLALKMVEWAGIRPNERVLEPSAGDGAIARYVPDFADLTMVEPSSDLSSRALLKAPHGKTVESTFESYHLVNKAHVIVMNPPFGSGGATAMQHLAKAAKHLRAGGRIVALIPTGPSADKRFDAWWEGDDAKGLSLSAEVALPAVAFERAGTNVMTRVVIIDKPAEGQEVAPDTQRLNFAGARSINEFFDRLEQYDVRRRPDPVRDVVEEMEAEGQDATAPMPQPVQGPPLAVKADAFKLAQVKHAKTGADLFVATIRDKVEREEYTAILAVAKQHGGYYSKFRGNGAVPGFQFKSEADRQAFLDDMAKPTVGFAEDGYDPISGDDAAFAAQIMQELAQVDDLFQNPRSAGTTLKTVFADIDPSITMGGRLAKDDPRAEGKGADTVTMLSTVKEDPFYVFETAAQVWIDVSNLNQGDGGSRIYSAISDYALNVGKVFIGDPESLSVKALRRRTDNMLSTALKHGTTRHIEPHPNQLEGHPKLGISALQWTEGDDLGNLASMIEVSVANLISHIPEVDDARYDFQTGTFRTGEGQPLTDGDLDKWASAAAGNRKARVGRATLKRGILLNTLARAESGERPGLLERSLRQQRQLVTRGGLRRTFYQVTSPQMVREAAASTEEIIRLMPRLRAELDRLDLKRVRLVADSDARDWQGMFHVTGDGALEIVIGASMDPMGTLHHEVIHALRTMNLFTPEEWRALELAAERSWIEKHDIAARYPDLLPHEQIEEAIAEEFSEALAAKKSPKGSALVTAFNKIARLFRALRNVLNGAGYQTAEDIFGRILAGEISKRQAGNTGMRAAMVQRQEQERPVVASLTGDEISRGADMREMGANAERWYRENLIGRTVRNISTGWDIKFNAVGAKKIGGRKGEDLYRIVAALEWIVADGALIETVQDRGGRPDIKAIHKIGARVVLDGIPKDVVVTIRETKDGTFHYDLSRDVSDGARFQREGAIPTAPLSNAQLGDPAFDGNPVNISIVESGAPIKFQRPQAVRPLSAQARAHRNTGMGGALFIPDRRVWEELTRATAPIWARLRNGAGGMSDGIDRARVYIQDRFLPVLRAQEAIERATGKRLPPEQRAYTAETTFSGKVGRHLFEVDEDFVKPIIRLIAASKGRLTAEAVGEWLYARHAIERNAKIASINPAMPDGGSGMTNAEAQQIIADAAASHDAARLVEIGSLIDKLRERTLSLREDAGLITHDEASDWRKMYRHYVPLKGFAETDHAEAVLDITGIGRRFNVRGGESRRALGRKSEAFNPLQAAFTQAQEVAIRAEKNRVGQSLHELAKDYPSKALWEVKKPAQKRYFNRSTGLVETRVEDPVSMILAPNEMAVKISGEEHRIIFHDERLARAAGTVGADQMGQITRLLSMFSRFWSMTRTMLNPEFAVTNAFRDFQTAQFNIQAFGAGDKGAIAKAMLRDWRKALAGSWRAQGNRYDSVWAKHYREFQKAGAQVSFWTIEQPETAKEDLDRRVRLASGTMAARALKRLTSPRAILSMRDNPALAMIERANIAVDNAIRLAAFVEARKRGWAVEDAAFLAKELTVNFNRRGEVGANMNALYPFFNAAVQGSVRTVKALTSRRVALMALTSIAAGMLNDLLNAWLSDEDDDGQLFYDKVPEYRNERNFHIVGWGTEQNPAAVPMPYGYNIFPYAGQNLGKVVRGVKSPSEAMGDVAAALFNAFSPVNGGSETTLVSPFFADPLIEMGENADWTGTPIYPRYPAVGAPDSEVYFSGASEASKAIASFLNSTTGGDFREAGWISVSPETLDHLSTFVTGSAGAFYGRAGDVLAKALEGNLSEIEVRNIPFVRIVVSPVGPWVDRDLFYDAQSEIRDANADVKAYADAGKPIPPQKQALANLYEGLLEANREMKGQGEWNQSKAGAKPIRPDDVVMKAFNRAYLEVLGKVKAKGP